MKYLIIVPDGVGIRNFIYSKFLDLLTETGEVTVWHTFSKEFLNNILPKAYEKINWVNLPDYRETYIEKISRHSRVFGQIHWKKNEGAEGALFELKRLRRKKDLKSKMVNTVAEISGYLFATKSKIALLDDIHLKHTQSNQKINKFKGFLIKEKPDVVCCTHQRAELAVPAIAAARSLGIPTATFIYSWDNLSKNRMAVQPDYYFVWGDKMREEMLEFYPEINQSRIFNVGTPQFEFYSNTELIKSKEQFYSELNLDINKKTICFSGDDVLTSPYDPYYLADLAEAVRKIEKEDMPQILFRRCPVDKSDRYNWVLEKYPEIIVSDPLWQFSKDQNWMGIIPKFDDVILLTNIIHHCDLVINLGSTMAMDFAVRNKPAIYFAYNPVINHLKKTWSVEEIYKLPHFKLIHKLQPVYWADCPENLTALISRILKNSNEKSLERKKWLEKILTLPIENSSQRIVDKLVAVAS